MDETDLLLCQMLLGNSRLPYTALADRAGISVQSVHRRIQNLVQSGVVQRFTASLSVKLLKAMPVYLAGRSEAKSMDQAVCRLEEDGSTGLVVVAGGNYLFVSALLQDPVDLETYVEFVRNAAIIPDLAVAAEGVAGYGDRQIHRRSGGDVELSPLDYRIVRALHGDSRKAIAEIAQELRASARTVRSHLARMTEAGAVEFTVRLDLGHVPGTTSFTNVRMKPGVDKARFRADLVERFGPRILFAMSYGNIPDELFVMTWSATSGQHEDLLKAVSADPAVGTLVSHALQSAHYSETWRDKLLIRRAAGA